MYLLTEGGQSSLNEISSSLSFWLNHYSSCGFFPSIKIHHLARGLRNPGIFSCSKMFAQIKCWLSELHHTILQLAGSMYLKWWMASGTDHGTKSGVVFLTETGVPTSGTARTKIVNRDGIMFKEALNFVRNFWRSQGIVGEVMKHAMNFKCPVCRHTPFWFWTVWLGVHSLPRVDLTCRR